MKKVGKTNESTLNELETLLKELDKSLTKAENSLKRLKIKYGKTLPLVCKEDK